MAELRYDLWIAALVLTAPTLAHAAATHPLDPLSAEEIGAATAALKADPELADAIIPLIKLDEPAKGTVLGWRQGEPLPPRRARVTAMKGTSVFEVLVDLEAKRIAQITERAGVEAPLTLGEQIEGIKVALDNPEFQAGLKKRGVTDLEKVFCSPFAAGYYGIEEHEGKRLLKVGCFDIRKSTNNLFGWPIEQLYALVDLRERKDGQENSLSQDVYEIRMLPAESPRRSVNVYEPRIPASEKEGQLDTGHVSAKYRVVNEATKNGVGNPASYELLYANHARLELAPEDWPTKRARFLEHDLWVTPYDPAERYAGGDYIFASKLGDGLARWTERDRPIRGQDIVVWANLGMHHEPRAEDMPVMPMIWHGFKLRPHNFFDRNPALDLRTGFATQ